MKNGSLFIDQLVKRNMIGFSDQPKSDCMKCANTSNVVLKQRFTKWSKVFVLPCICRVRFNLSGDNNV